MKKVTIFTGSPHRSGASHFLAKRMLNVFRDHDIDAEIVSLTDLKISYCQACDYCIKNGPCVIEDDMQDLYKKLEESAGMVLVSPCYFGQMTAQMKTFIDRWYACYKEKGLTFAGIKTGILWVQADNIVAPYQTYYDYTKEIMEHFGLDIQEVMVAEGIGRMDDLELNTGVILQAESMAQRITDNLHRS